MKRNLFLFSALLISSIVLAQAPQSFKYQAAVRNNAGNLITEQNVGFQIDILKGAINGASVYTETHSATTSNLGLVNLEIGTGTSTDDIASINWGEDTYFLQISLDITGGTSYELMGVSQLLSVPYALHAGVADSINGGIVEIDPVFTSSVASSITEADTTKWNNKLDSFTESQTLSISGDTLSIRDGNSVILPSGGAIPDRGNLIVIFSGNITDAEAAQKVADEVGANTRYIRIENTSQLTTVDLSGVRDIIEFTAMYNESLTDIAFGDLESGRDIIFERCPSLTAVDLPKLETCISFSVNVCQLLSSLDISNLNSVTELHMTSCHGLTTLDISKLEVAREVQIIKTALESIQISNLSTFDTFTTSYNKLTSTTVNNFLAHFVSISPNISGKTIHMEGQNPPASPTGQGIPDKATLEANGNSIYTD